MVGIDGIVLAPHWLWLIGAVVLAIAEIVAPGFFLIWIAVAALLTGVATALVGLALPGQMLLFVALAPATVFAVRRWLVTHPIASDDPLLNDRLARLIGEMVTVEEAVDMSGGRVRVGDSIWSARGPAAPVGALVRIVGSDGNGLLVQPD